MTGLTWWTKQISQSAKLRAFVIWLVSLPGDTSSTWDANLMPDPQVVHLWDAKRFAGPWFAKNVDGADGFMWDTYLLYGPNASWDAAPAPLVDPGATIVDLGPQLREHLAPLISSS